MNAVERGRLKFALKATLAAVFLLAVAVWPYAVEADPADVVFGAFFFAVVAIAGVVGFVKLGEPEQGRRRRPPR